MSWWKGRLEGLTMTVDFTFHETPHEELERLRAERAVDDKHGVHRLKHDVRIERLEREIRQRDGEVQDSRRGLIRSQLGS